MTHVHIREDRGETEGHITRSMHDSDTQYSCDASVSAAAKRALWSICHEYEEQLRHTEFRHLPRCARGTEQTILTLREPMEERVNVLLQVTAALNTDLENTTTELENAHDKLRSAYARIAQLEAQAVGREPPEEKEVECPYLSPPWEGLCHEDDGATTRVHGQYRN